MKRSFYARFSWPIIAAVALLLPFTVWAAVLALKTNENDVKEWLPDTFQATQDYRRFQQHFGDETFVLVSWPGATLNDPRVDQLAQRLTHPEPGQPRYYAKAATGGGLMDRLMSHRRSFRRPRPSSVSRGRWSAPTVSRRAPP